MCKPVLWWWVAQGWLWAAGAPTISVLPHCWPWTHWDPLLGAQRGCSLAPARFHEVWRTVFNGPSFKPPKVFRCPWGSWSPWPQNLLPCGKYCPNTPQPLPLHPPPLPLLLIWVRSSSLQCVSSQAAWAGPACEQTVNKRRGLGKNSEFCTRAARAG